MLDCLILSALGLWLFLALRACARGKASCGGCSGCCGSCRGCSSCGARRI